MRIHHVHIEHMINKALHNVHKFPLIYFIALRHSLIINGSMSRGYLWVLTFDHRCIRSMAWIDGDPRESNFDVRLSVRKS